MSLLQKYCNDMYDGWLADLDELQRGLREWQAHYFAYRVRRTAERRRLKRRRR